MAAHATGDRLLLAATAIALLLPLAANEHEATGRVALGVPAVSSGDEPHYLLALNSLLAHGDLDLADDYASVHAGSGAAGRRYASAALGHHTVWFVGDERVRWAAMYEDRPEAWRRDHRGRPVPTPRRATPSRLLAGAEYPTHPPGQALLLAAMLWPLRGSGAVEPAALLVSALVSIAGLLWLRSLALAFTDDRTAAAAVAALAFLGTPLWHYARSLFTEPWLATCAVGATALVLRDRSRLAAGALIGTGMAMKPPFAVLLLPLAAFAIRRDGARGAAALLAAPALAGAGILAANAAMFGAPLRAAQAFTPGNPLAGVVGLALSPWHGIALIAPIAVVALLGWPALAARRRAIAWVPLTAFALYALVMATWGDWRGGYCYGPRLIAPVLPLLCLGLAGVPATAAWRHRGARLALAAVAAVSVAMNGWAAFHHVSAFGAQPLAALLAIASG